MKKKVLIILSIVLAISISFVAFSETIDELKERFVSRDEWAEYISGMQSTLDSLEQNMMISIQDECEYQMYRRDILGKEKIESMSSDSSGREKLESMSRRLESDATNPYQY